MKKSKNLPRALNKINKNDKEIEKLNKINNTKKNIIQNFLFYLKSFIFRNKDILTGEELVEYGVISSDTFKSFCEIKRLRKLNNIYYIWDYDKKFKKLIFSYKFFRKIKLSKIIAELIEEEFRFVIEKEKIDYIITVPINKKRKNERGFNQVDEILKQLNINFIKLKRIKNTKKMYKLLDEKLREENVKNSFYIDDKFDYKNKKLLLVDDIITTGATLKEIKKSILNKYNKENIEITVFCLAAAKEIKMSKGEI